MSNLVFPAQDQALVQVSGSEKYFPVHRIFCVGRNYHAHAAEMGIEVDKSQQEPFYFTKHPSTLVASGSTVAYPPQTQNYHYEIEMVVAIGKAGFRVSEEEANELVFAYATGLDMTRRDLQLKARSSGRPWDLGKDFEESAIISELIPKEDTGIMDHGEIRLSVNGQVKQSSDVSLLIWNVNEIICHLSQFYHLQPGDLIFTGTPDGVGPVVSGDCILGSVAGLQDLTLEIS